MSPLQIIIRSKIAVVHVFEALSVEDGGGDCLGNHRLNLGS